LNLLNDLHERSWRSRILPFILGTSLMTSAWGQSAPATTPPAATPAQTTPAAIQPAAASGSAEARAAATTSLLGRAKAAIQQRNYVDAVELYRRARVNAQPLPNMQPQVAELRRSLEAIGIDATLLDMAPSSPPTGQVAGTPNQVFLMPQNATAVPGTDVAAIKTEAIRLVTEGRAALDRGALPDAIRLVKQAERLAVPESAFQPGEARVWQLALDVRSAARKAGVPFESDPVASSGVAQAGGVMMADGGASARVGDGVTQSLFIEGQDQSKVQPAQATGPLAPLPIEGDNEFVAPQTPEGEGVALYQQGLTALADGNTARARELFVEAWKHEATLDLATRTQLKEKLTFLQPTRLPDPAKMSQMTPIEQAQSEAEAETRRVYREITSELAKTNEMKTTDPLGALERLQSLHGMIDDTKLDAASAASLKAMVNRAIEDQKQYVEANRADIELNLANDAVKAQLSSDQATTQRVDDEIASLVETFNDLMDERRYPEAEVVAKKVNELSPGSSIAKSMHHTSRMGTRLMINEDIASSKEDAFAKNLLAVDAAGIGMDPARDIDFGDAQSWGELSRRRQTGGDSDSRYSPIERQIKQQMSTPVEVNYRDTPLAGVLQDLAAVANISIVLDQRAMTEMQIASDSPVNMQLTQPVSLRSALNLILSDFELTYIIENDVLKITSHDVKKTRVYSKAYKVADLITPIPNFSSGYEDGLAGALRAAYQMTNQQANVQVMPMAGLGLANNNLGPTNPNPNALAQFGAAGSTAATLGGANGYGNSRGPQDSAGAGGGFMPFELMNLIQTTISPNEWIDGTYSIAPYMQNLSLVISTTTEVHDQIAALLESLRKLQNIQVTIEVRFITLSDSFFEQIGVDFDISYEDNIERMPYGDRGPRVKIGWDGSNPTADFDIKLNNDFGVTPAFGAFDPGTGSRIGFAILDDISAFFFLQAAQGDARTNVLQAPKVTLFDGQQASINDTVNRPFVMSIQPVVGDFAVAQQPIVVVINEGTQLTVQAVVSDDKRFVRMTLMPYFSQIGEVNTFTFEGRRRSQSTNVERDPVTGEPINDSEEEEVFEGTTVQQPTLATTSVSTTVSVPDGGTILLGGIKRMREGRNERGVPILSKIPYISRLFRNVAIGRDAQSLMMMVTPRIIIQEEEELVQTGFDPSR
jgi:general secretion pathway protein D